MIFRVRNRIHNHEERWAAGIMFVTGLMTVLLLNSLPYVHIYSDITWLFSLYQGFLVAVALKYGFQLRPIKIRSFGVVGVAVSAVFIAGTYMASFGAQGYKSMEEKLVARFTDGYHPYDAIRILDNEQRKPEAYMASLKGVTQVFATGTSSRMESRGNLWGMWVFAPSQGDHCIEGWLSMFLNERLVFAHSFNSDGFTVGNRHAAGEKRIYYYDPSIKDGELQVKVKMEKKMRKPYKKEYGEFGVNVDLIPFEKAL